MSAFPGSEKYEPLIKSIKKKKTVILVITLFLLAAVVLLCGHLTIVIAGKTLYEHAGVHPAVMAVLLVLVLLFELFAVSFVMMPLTRSLDVECDPAKHLALNTALNRRGLPALYCVSDYFLLGEFETALTYADTLIGHSNRRVRLVGLFNKARCEFFIGDYEALTLYSEQYHGELETLEKVGRKSKETFLKLEKILDMLVALAQNDAEKIQACRDIESWGESKAQDGFVNYLKGLAAQKTNETDEAVYRFMFVKENCPKTVLAKLAQERLAEMKPDP